MLIEQALLTKLQATTTLTAVTGDHIYPVLSPQDTDPPAVVVTKTASPRMLVNKAATVTMALARFQFDVFSETYKEAKEIANIIRQTLEQFSGEMGGTGGVAVLGCYYENESDGYEEQVNLYRVTVAITIRYQE